jgi:hypothetical protein
VSVADVIYQGNVTLFFKEVTASLSEYVQFNEPITTEVLNKLKIEINGSKLAYNISIDELSKNLFLVFLSLPSVVESFANFSKVSYQKYYCDNFRICF